MSWPARPSGVRPSQEKRQPRLPFRGRRGRPVASGQRVVQYNNRRIEYHSLTELSALRDRIAASLASGPAARPRRILLRHGGKGIT